MTKRLPGRYRVHDAPMPIDLRERRRVVRKTTIDLSSPGARAGLTAAARVRAESEATEAALSEINQSNRDFWSTR